MSEVKPDAGQVAQELQQCFLKPASAEQVARMVHDALTDFERHKRDIEQKLEVCNLTDEQVLWSLERDRFNRICRDLAKKHDDDNAVRFLLDVFNAAAKVSAERQGAVFFPVGFDDLPVIPVMGTVDSVRVDEEALDIYQRTYGVPFLVRDLPQREAAEPGGLQP
ncbi:MAG: hypothetical protein BWK73_26745 [Thiothrix lacustris]|uniref:Uncharacterized protein n=1 Tax=Thiothrix lacustris TaxID=525917 RepID=A0A1Y1QKG1_9GAMM|nr:MAG: hypothetical protein BWK73_26745 [Thiothrix lacustris]